MDTHGHERVAQTAGLPLLSKATKKSKDELQSFYLGNWLADVSQFVDPVAYECGYAGIEGAVSGIVDRIVGALFQQRKGAAPNYLDFVGDQVKLAGENAKKALLCDLEAFFTLQADKDSILAQFFRDAFFVCGYFKFVHPSTIGGFPRMDFNVFKEIFNGELGKNTPGS